MKIPDVNVLVAAFRLDHTAHDVARGWLRGVLESGETLGLSHAVGTGVVRLLTQRRLWSTPDTPASALRHLEALRSNPGVIDALPGPRHWEIFAQLCREGDARGNLVSDAAHAAIAIEHGATFVSFDRDFARFPGLRWELLS
ncbi:PIN domain-containing protein [Microbacterium sp. NEAU-LLC]|uniref:Ribonuclease VapC n=1 Tax=Microbacterium helvum TaxID=2773713 RepID=A0ABR8NQH5_9MICO|nr:TA system VapC family ribonuclease toxin [Microbacterium helvum]MBD3942713.1 PIN domain-containing protein [Microbacterium helvum]